MRRLPLILGLLAVLNLSTAAVAQEPISWANKFFTGKDQVPPPKVLHDFGTMPKGTIKTYRFNMKNIYAVPMQVGEPKPNCGCVSVIEYTGKMGPNESGHIDIKIDTSRVEGYKSVDLPVYFEGRDAKTNEKFWSYAKLEIRAVSRPDISITPGSIQFGVVPAGEKVDKVVNVLYSGRQRDWKISEPQFKKDLFDVVVAQVAVKTGTAFQVTATLKKSAAFGAFDEQIILKTNDPASPILTLTATGTVQSPLRIVGGDMGDVLKMGGVEVGKKLERNVIVQAATEFKLVAVEGQAEGVSVPLIKQLKPAKSQVVTVTFAPEKVGPVKQVLTIKTDSGDSIKLTVEGTGKDP